MEHCLTHSLPEEKNHPEDQQGSVGVVVDSHNQVLCRVEDTKQYQLYLDKPSSITKKSKLKGKAKSITAPTIDDAKDNLASLPFTKPGSSNIRAEFVNIDLDALVSLSPDDEYWANLDETEVEFRDEEQVTRWKTAGDWKAAWDAGLTWKEKQLADFEGNEIMYKFYSGWKAAYSGQRDKKRSLDRDGLEAEEEEPVPKKCK